MARYVLQKCHIRGKKVAPDRGAESQAFSLASLTEKFASRTLGGRQVLLALKTGYYIGLISSRYGVTNFILGDLPRPRDITFILRKDPSFAGRVLEIFHVEAIELDGGVKELRNTA